MDSKLKKHLQRLSLSLVLLLSGVGGMLWFHRLIQTTYAHFLQAQASIQSGPEAVAHEAQLKRSLELAQPVVMHLQEMVLTTDSVDTFVAHLQDEGKKFSVQVQVPDIQPVQVKDKDGKIIPPTGPLMDIQVQIVASGPPTDVMHFFYALEHEPYLLRVIGWHYLGKGNASVTVSSGRASAPTTTILPPSGGEPTLQAVPAQLQIDTVVTLENKTS